MERRDFIGARQDPKSGAFICQLFSSSSAPYNVFYGSEETPSKRNQEEEWEEEGPAKGDKEWRNPCLLLPFSLELASQLHREVERFGLGSLVVFLNAFQSRMLRRSGTAGKNGIDILISTPLRLVDSIEKGPALL
jgi:ATP-dependent RNA helicase DDX52/ROK1